MNASESPKKFVSRRTVLNAVGWSAPAVAFAAAAPAASASVTNGGTTIDHQYKLTVSGGWQVTSMPDGADYGSTDIASQPYISITDAGSSWNTGPVTVIFELAPGSASFYFRPGSSFATGVETAVTGTLGTTYSYDGMPWSVYLLSSTQVSATSDMGFDISGGVADQRLYLPHIKGDLGSFTPATLSIYASSPKFTIPVQYVVNSPSIGD